MDLEQILADVERELRSELQTKALAKADDGKSPGSSPDAAGSPDPAAAGGPPGGDAGGGPPPPGASAGPPGGGDAPPPGPDASMAPPPDASSAGAAPDLGALKAEYEQLPTEELQMHYLACKAALFAKMGSSSPSMSPSPSMGGAPGAAGASAPPPGPDASSSPMPPPGSASSSSAAPPPPAMKGEMGSGAKVAGSPANGGKSAVTKSEQELNVDKEALEKIVTLEKMVEGLTKAVELVVSAPQRKSIKGVSELAFLGKNDASSTDPKPLTKAEVKEKLAEKAKNPALSKSDKDLIRSFYVGNCDVAKIEHLLK